MDITHEDYTNAVESHPYLPLYVTGNARGMLCLWEFSQREDQSLDYWTTEDLNHVDHKRSTIRKIQFNTYGDKVYCQNLEGNIFAFNFDTNESSKTVPIYS